MGKMRIKMDGGFAKYNALSPRIMRTLKDNRTWEHSRSTPVHFLKELARIHSGVSRL